MKRSTAVSRLGAGEDAVARAEHAVELGILQVLRGRLLDARVQDRVDREGPQRSLRRGHQASRYQL